ncbi:MAG: hypothetical protein HRT66_05125 [Flavobacteriaceae bacterium]|nr:hypothetical protein [Flavobacteriaceae bacterium]
MSSKFKIFLIVFSFWIGFTIIFLSIRYFLKVEGILGAAIIGAVFGLFYPKISRIEVNNQEKIQVKFAFFKKIFVF